MTHSKRAFVESFSKYFAGLDDLDIDEITIDEWRTCRNIERFYNKKFKWCDDYLDTRITDIADEF